MVPNCSRGRGHCTQALFGMRVLSSVFSFSNRKDFQITDLEKFTGSNTNCSRGRGHCTQALFEMRVLSSVFSFSNRKDFQITDLEKFTGSNPPTKVLKI